MLSLRYILPVLALLVPLWTSAVIYYVSPTGNDTNNGTSTSTPWRTVARAQQAASSLQPGDQILFQRGGRYTGKLTINSNGNASNPIIVGAYGTGAAPIIAGSTTVTGWTQFQGNIWRAPVNQPVKFVWSNSNTMTLARFPNTGWLRTTWASNNQLNSASINQPNGTWVGGEVVLRSRNWCYEVPTISAQNNGTLTYSAITFDPGNYDWGFFLQNKLSALDAAGEWFYESTSGFLYFWAPANANPNSLTVEAAVHEYGLEIGWQRQHIRIQNLAFTQQRNAGVHNQGGNFIQVTGCAFDRQLTAIKSFGNNGVYANNTVNGTYGSGMSLVDNNTLVEGNQFTNIAMVAGMGESAWGYFGMYILGSGNTVRSNRLDNIGYSGIFFEGNTLVEKNVVSNVVKVLNDGGGIYFDNSNGGVVQDNIISDVEGNLESTALNYFARWYMGHGIFFGNGATSNVMVRRNTVTRCNGSGIFVDHTMNSTGFQVRDNVLFNNRAQLSITDFSNNVGPGATPPFHVPSFNDIYSGNIMYSLYPEQFCMEQFNNYSANHVDYGTFTNNKYFNPYNELSIRLSNTVQYNQRLWSLERWQSVFNEDAGSSRSPQRLEQFEVLSTLTGNLVPNGNFTTNIANWSGWPTQGQLSHDLSVLDAGALRVAFSNNSASPEYYLRHNPTSVALVSGAYYELRFSTQATGHGNLRVEVKGQSQASSSNFVHSRGVPVDGQRRDHSIIFQSDRNEAAQTFVASRYDESTYWLDNVELYRVTVQPVVPTDRHILLVNDQATAQSFPLPPGCWSNVAGVQVSSPVQVAAYASMPLYRTAATGCASSTVETVGVKVALSGPMDWTTGQMNATLVGQGLLPASEPYSAMGFTLANSGATASASVLQATGVSAPVDWVLLETRGTAPGYTVVERRAAILRANGTVVTPDGNVQIGFTNGVSGKHLVVQHRNHLGAMTANPIAGTGLSLDFTNTSLALHGQNSVYVNGQTRALWPGDVNGDGVVKYTGVSNDRDVVLVGIGAVVPSNSVAGYRVEDVNLDGVVKYTGNFNDRDIILQAIGGVVPTYTVVQQVP